MAERGDPNDIRIVGWTRILPMNLVSRGRMRPGLAGVGALVKPSPWETSIRMWFHQTRRRSRLSRRVLPRAHRSRRSQKTRRKHTASTDRHSWFSRRPGRAAEIEGVLIADSFRRPRPPDHRETARCSASEGGLRDSESVRHLFSSSGEPIECPAGYQSRPAPEGTRYARSDRPLRDPTFNLTWEYQIPPVWCLTNTCICSQTDR